MRFVRSLAGLLFGAAGILLLLAAGTGWQLAQHRDPTGGFSAELSPVHSDGYAIVVPDLAGAIRRHGLARLIDSTELRVRATSSTPLVLAVAPTAEVNRFLEGVGRTVVTGVGYGVGAQVVGASSVLGTGAPAVLPQQSSWVATTDWLRWSVQTDTPMSLLVLRSDGKPGLTATVNVSLAPPRWASTVSWLALAGGLLLVAAGLVLVRPARTRRRRERYTTLAPHYPAQAEPDDAGWVVGAYGADVDSPVTPAQPYRPAGDSPYVYTAT